MQLFVLSLLFLSTFTESSSVESDQLSSVDIIVFSHSQQASRHWDCPRVRDRVAKAEEARIWQAVLPDARIEELVVLSESKAFLQTEQYKWTNELNSNPFMQNSVLLGMRKPDFGGSTGTVPVKVLCSKSKQVNQDALSAMLPQLEQSKDSILESMARTQVSVTSMPLKTTDSLVDHRFRVPPAENYHPRVFRGAQFTTGDLVALMALAAESRKKDHADAFKFFKLMVESFLPGFSVSLGAVPKNSAGKPTKTAYLHRSFQYVPAGADLAFYFDGNRGKFLSLREDSIVLNRPEGIVDGQQHAVLVLSPSANVDASNLEMHQTTTKVAVREAFCKELEKVPALDIPSKATETTCLLAIRSHAARLERDSFLEAQRRVLESRPTLLIELLPGNLVKLVIDYFSDDTYPFIVSAHKWLLNNAFGIAVDSARVYVITESEGLKGLSHSLANLKEDERRYIEFGNPQWFDYLQFTSSHDGRRVSFGHKYNVSKGHRKQTKRSAKCFLQRGELEGGRFESVAFDDKNLPYGLLSRDGQTLCSHGVKLNSTTRVYQIVEKARKSPAVILKSEHNGLIRAVSGNGNRIMVTPKKKQLEIHNTGKSTCKLLCQINDLTSAWALNENGSEAAFVNGSELRIMQVDKVVKGTVDQPAIVSVKVPKSLGEIYQLVYSDENKLHVLHSGGSVSLFDSLIQALIPIEIPQEGLKIIDEEISPNAEYIVTLQRVREEEKSGKSTFRTIVKRKLKRADWRNLFGYKTDIATKP